MQRLSQEAVLRRSDTEITPGKVEFRVGDLAKGKGRREGLEAYCVGKVKGLKLDLARIKGHFYVRDAVQDERIR